MKRNFPCFAILIILLAQSLNAYSLPQQIEKTVKVDDVLRGAHAQIGITIGYDPMYRKIGFPGGDVDQKTGVCTDVIVRAYRAAGIDLQALVHHDMRRAFRRYPQKWGLRGPDTNIDHRRVPNLALFFQRYGKSFPVSQDPKAYLPGDIVTWILPNGRDHIGLVSDREKDGRRLVVHNIGFGTRADDVLFAFRIVGHYRYGF